MLIYIYFLINKLFRPRYYYYILVIFHHVDKPTIILQYLYKNNCLNDGIMHSTCLTLTLQTKTIAIRCASLTRSFCHFQQVSRYVSYREPSIAIRIVSWGVPYRYDPKCKVYQIKATDLSVEEGDIAILPIGINHKAANLAILY